MHVDVIKLLQVRLEKTFYSRVEDQTMVWAYLSGFSDGAAKKKMEDTFVNVVFSPSIHMPPPASSAPHASIPKTAPVRKKVAIKKQSAPKQESAKLQKAREEAKKRVRANVKSRLSTLNK